MLALFQMGGPWEVAIILLMVLIIFGAGKLPKVMGQLGRGVKSFKDGMKDGDAEGPVLKEIETSAEDIELAEEVRAEETRRS